MSATNLIATDIRDDQPEPEFSFRGARLLEPIDHSGYIAFMENRDWLRWRLPLQYSTWLSRPAFHWTRCSPNFVEEKAIREARWLPSSSLAWTPATPDEEEIWQQVVNDVLKLKPRDPDDYWPQLDAVFDVVPKVRTANARAATPIIHRDPLNACVAARLRDRAWLDNFVEDYSWAINSEAPSAPPAPPQDWKLSEYYRNRPLRRVVHAVSAVTPYKFLGKQLKQLTCKVCGVAWPSSAIVEVDDDYVVSKKTQLCTRKECVDARKVPDIARPWVKTESQTKFEYKQSTCAWTPSAGVTPYAGELPSRVGVTPFRPVPFEGMSRSKREQRLDLGPVRKSKCSQEELDEARVERATAFRSLSHMLRFNQNISCAEIYQALNQLDRALNVLCPDAAPADPSLLDDVDTSIYETPNSIRDGWLYIHDSRNNEPDLSGPAVLEQIGTSMLVLANYKCSITNKYFQQHQRTGRFNGASASASVAHSIRWCSPEDPEQTTRRIGGELADQEPREQWIQRDGKMVHQIVMKVPEMVGGTLLGEAPRNRMVWCTWDDHFYQKMMELLESWDGIESDASKAELIERHEKDKANFQNKRWENFGSAAVYDSERLHGLWNLPDSTAAELQKLIATIQTRSDQIDKRDGLNPEKMQISEESFKAAERPSRDDMKEWNEIIGLPEEIDYFKFEAPKRIGGGSSEKVETEETGVEEVETEDAETEEVEDVEPEESRPPHENHGAADCYNNNPRWTDDEESPGRPEGFDHLVNKTRETNKPADSTDLEAARNLAITEANAGLHYSPNDPCEFTHSLPNGARVNTQNEKFQSTAHILKVILSNPEPAEKAQSAEALRITSEAFQDRVEDFKKRAQLMLNKPDEIPYVEITSEIADAVDHGAAYLLVNITGGENGWKYYRLDLEKYGSVGYAVAALQLAKEKEARRKHPVLAKTTPRRGKSALKAIDAREERAKAIADIRHRYDQIFHVDRMFVLEKPSWMGLLGGLAEAPQMG